MKKILIALTLLALAACQPSDKEIRANIAGKAQEDLNFAGLHYTVDKGIVEVSGRCPSEKAFKKIKQTIQGIHVIKDVHYNVTIAPVVLDSLTPVKLHADSLLAQFPRVTAAVTPPVVTLKGEVTAAERTKLLKTFRLPDISLVKDSLSVVR